MDDNTEPADWLDVLHFSQTPPDMPEYYSVTTGRTGWLGTVVRYDEHRWAAGFRTVLMGPEIYPTQEAAGAALRQHWHDYAKRRW